MGVSTANKGDFLKDHLKVANELMHQDKLKKAESDLPS